MEARVLRQHSDVQTSKHLDLSGSGRLCRVSALPSCCCDSSTTYPSLQREPPSLSSSSFGPGISSQNLGVLSALVVSFLCPSVSLYPHTFLASDVAGDGNTAASGNNDFSLSLSRVTRIHTCIPHLVFTFTYASYTRAVDVPRIAATPSHPSPPSLRDHDEPRIDCSLFTLERSRTTLFLSLYPSRFVDCPLSLEIGLSYVRRNDSNFVHENSISRLGIVVRVLRRVTKIF